MSKDKKADTPKDEIDLEESSQADLEKSSPSGSPCICKDKRNIMCTLHGG